MKTRTVEDYDSAIRDFLSHLDPLGDDVASILLYGSVARGDVVPGESDLMDAHVFLRDEVFQDKESFLQSLEIMVEACQRLSQTGLPFHPYHYFSLHEAALSPAMYLPTWRSDRTSKVLKGEDVRPCISSTETSHAVAATSFFNARRTTAHLLAFYLAQEEWSAEEQKKIRHRLASLKKHICIMGCFALGIPAEASEAVAKLRERLPNLDTSVLPTIDSLRNKTETLQEPQALRQVLRDALMFVEHLHDEIVAARRVA